MSEDRLEGMIAAAEIQEAAQAWRCYNHLRRFGYDEQAREYRARAEQLEDGGEQG